jgi:hypothetical protein
MMDNVKNIKNEKPIGITIIAYLFGVSGVVLILLGIIVLILGLGGDIVPGKEAIAYTLSIGGFILLLVLGSYYLVNGVYLRKLKNWARISTIVLSSLHIILSLTLLFLFKIYDFISILLSAFVIYYLSKQEIKELFTN